MVIYDGIMTPYQPTECIKMIKKKPAARVYKVDTENTKCFNIRVPKAMWIFLKRHAMDNETSMNAIVSKLIEQYQTKTESK